MKTQPPETLKHTVIQLFRDVLQAPDFDARMVEKYFDPAYVQTVDGVTLDYAAFVSHIQKQKDIIASMEVDFLKLVAEGDTVFSNHVVTAIKKDGGTIKAKVIAQFTWRNNRLIACDELTHILQGLHEDRDIGSRH